MITLREYAESRNMSYEAVRQKVSKYRDELPEHIIQQGKRTYLDPVAVDFLDEHRQIKEIVLESNDYRVEELEAEIKAKTEQIQALQAIIMQDKTKIESLSGELLESERLLASARIELLEMKTEPSKEATQHIEQLIAAQQELINQKDRQAEKESELARVRAELTEARAREEQLTAQSAADQERIKALEEALASHSAADPSQEEPTKRKFFWFW